MRVTPEMLAVAWRAFKGDRQRMGPGPGFQEAIAALAPLILEEAARAAENAYATFPAAVDPDWEYERRGAEQAAFVIRILKDA